jgi:hypothetical protein
MMQIPKGSGGNRGNQYTGGKTDTVVDFAKTKEQVVNELGFSQKQAERFEILAENKDIIEQVKAEARENNELPTRSRVLVLAGERKKASTTALSEQQQTDDAEYFRHVDRVAKVSRTFIDALSKINCIHVDDDELLEVWMEGLPDYSSIDEELKNITRARRQLDALEAFLHSKKKLRLVRF